MLVAIISDIHDNLVNLEKCLNWCPNNNIEVMICCGDVTNSDTIKYLAKHFREKIHLIKGNMEIYNDVELEKYENITYYGKIGRFEIGGKTVGVCHEPFYIEDVIKKGKCDIIFYGHTHRPWEENRQGVRAINPGTLGGMFQKSTFAVWNTEKGNIELIILDNMRL